MYRPSFFQSILNKYNIPTDDINVDETTIIHNEVKDWLEVGTIPSTKLNLNATSPLNFVKPTDTLSLNIGDGLDVNGSNLQIADVIDKSNLHISIDSSTALSITNNSVESYKKLLVHNSGSGPWYSFYDHNTTGISSDASKMYFWINGSITAEIDSGGFITSGTISLQNGSVSAPSLHFENDSKTGLYSTGPDNISITSNGNNIGFIDSVEFRIGTKLSFDSTNYIYLSSSNTIDIYNNSTSSLTISDSIITTTKPIVITGNYLNADNITSQNNLTTGNLIVNHTASIDQLDFANDKMQGNSSNTNDRFQAFFTQIGLGDTGKLSRVEIGRNGFVWPSYSPSILLIGGEKLSLSYPCVFSFQTNGLIYPQSQFIQRDDFTILIDAFVNSSNIYKRSNSRNQFQINKTTEGLVFSTSPAGSSNTDCVFTDCLTIGEDSTISNKELRIENNLVIVDSNILLNRGNKLFEIGPESGSNLEVFKIAFNSPVSYEFRIFPSGITLLPTTEMGTAMIDIKSRYIESDMMKLKSTNDDGYFVKLADSGNRIEFNGLGSALNWYWGYTGILNSTYFNTSSFRVLSGANGIEIKPEATRVEFNPIGTAKTFNFGYTSSLVNTIFNTGNVAIGNTIPLAKLHVESSAVSTNIQTWADDVLIRNNGDCGITIGSSTNASGSIAFSDSGGTMGGMSYYHGTDMLALRANGGNRFELRSDGTLKFSKHIVYETTGARGVYQNSTSINSYNWFEFSNTNYMIFGAPYYRWFTNSTNVSSGSEKMRLTTTGLSINTGNSPIYPLHVNGTIAGGTFTTPFTLTASGTQLYLNSGGTSSVIALRPNGNGSNASELNCQTNTTYLRNSSGVVYFQSSGAGNGLTLGHSTANSSFLQFTGTTTSSTSINFGDTDDANAGEILYNHSTNNMTFYADGTEKVQINTGYLETKNNIAFKSANDFINSNSQNANCGYGEIIWRENSGVAGLKPTAGVWNVVPFNTVGVGQGISFTNHGSGQFSIDEYGIYVVDVWTRIHRCNSAKLRMERSLDEGKSWSYFDYVSNAYADESNECDSPIGGTCTYTNSVSTERFRFSIYVTTSTSNTKLGGLPTSIAGISEYYGTVSFRCHTTL